MELSLAEIIVLIQTEAGCYRLIRHYKYANHQFQCRRCGCENEQRQDDPRWTKCAECPERESLTANTVFHQHRKPLKVLLPIVLSVVAGDGQSACAVSRRMGQWYSTVWEWQKKARSYFASLLSPDKTQAVHESFLLRVLIRRTTESEPVLDDSIRLPEDQTEGDELQDSELIQFENNENFAPNCDNDSPADNDSNKEIIPQPEDLLGVGTSIRYLADIFHYGVGLKHAPGYAAQLNFIIHCPGQVQTFLRECFSSPPRKNPRSNFLPLPVVATSSYT